MTRSPTEAVIVPLRDLPAAARSDALAPDTGVAVALGKDGMPRIGRRGNQVMIWRGITFRSKAELRFAQELELRRRAGDVEWWAYEVALPLVVNGTLYRRHRVDFVVARATDPPVLELHEIKGHVERHYRLLVDLIGLTVLRVYPGVRYFVNGELVTWKTTRTATRAALPNQPTRKAARRR